MPTSVAEINICLGAIRRVSADSVSLAFSPQNVVLVRVSMKWNFHYRTPGSFTSVCAASPAPHSPAEGLLSTTEVRSVRMSVALRTAHVCSQNVLTRPDTSTKCNASRRRSHYVHARKTSESPELLTRALDALQTRTSSTRQTDVHTDPCCSHSYRRTAISRI